jgi:glutaredoxin-related protein
LERNGLAEDYDADIQAFKNIDNPQLFVDGQFINAKDFMKQLDDEIEGINSVLECTLG